MANTCNHVAVFFVLVALANGFVLPNGTLTLQPGTLGDIFTTVVHQMTNATSPVVPAPATPIERSAFPWVRRNITDLTDDDIMAMSRDQLIDVLEQALSENRSVMARSTNNTDYDYFMVTDEYGNNATTPSVHPVSSPSSNGSLVLRALNGIGDNSPLKGLLEKIDFGALEEVCNQRTGLQHASGLFSGILAGTKPGGAPLIGQTIKQHAGAIAGSSLLCKVLGRLGNPESIFSGLFSELLPFPKTQ